MCRVLSSELVAMACTEHEDSSSSMVSVGRSNTQIDDDCSGYDMDFSFPFRVVGEACAVSDSSAVMSLERSAAGSPETLSGAAFSSPANLAALDSAQTAEVFGCLFANSLLRDSCDNAVSDSDSEVWSVGGLGDSLDFDEGRSPLTGAAAALAQAAAEAECVAHAKESSAADLAARAAVRQAALELELERPEANHEHVRLAITEATGAVCSGVRSFIAQDVCLPSNWEPKNTSRAPTRATSVEPPWPSSYAGSAPGSQTPRGAALHAVRAAAAARLE